jgi:hypothetical protein
MTVTIIGTGNHYVLDCLGAAALLALSSPLVWAAARLRRRVRCLPPQVRYELPAALSLCLVCAGILGSVGGSGSVRPLIVLGVLLLLGLATGGSRYPWTRAAAAGDGTATSVGGRPSRRLAVPRRGDGGSSRSRTLLQGRPSSCTVSCMACPPY